MSRATFAAVSLIPLLAKGIHVYRRTLPFSPQFSGPLIARDTLTAPASLSLFGVGEVEVVAVDPAVKYTARLERLSGGLNEAKIATGSHIAISHRGPAEQFAIRAVDTSKH